MAAQNMEGHHNIYLYLVMGSLSDTKIAVEFVFKDFDRSNERIMDVDTF